MNNSTTSLPVEAVLSERSAPAAFVFVREVASLYHSNAWLFLKMLLPAALFGYCALYLCMNRATEIGQQLPRGIQTLQHRSEVLEILAFRFGGFAADWVFYCFAFAGMTVAVRKLVDGSPVEVEDCFQPVRERLLSFLSLSFVLWLFTALACLISVGLLSFLSIRFPDLFRWASIEKLPLGFVGLFFGMWVVSRFGLAIPALILEKCDVKQSFFRSDELTKSCWIILAILLVESVGGSYLAYLLPQWLASFAYAHRFVPTWLSWAALAVGLLLGVALQPHLLVGFALLHTRRAAWLKPGSEHFGKA